MFLAKDEGEELAEWRACVAPIIQAVQGIDGVQAEIRTKGQAASPEITPRAYITLADSYGLTPGQVTDELKAGDPPIATKLYGDDIAIDPMTLMPGEAEVIARRLVEVLMPNRKRHVRKTIRAK